MELIDIKVPDIGDFDEVDVVEVLVNPGDTVDAEGLLITLESDKASMEIPSTHAGVIKEMLVAVGDKVKTGSTIAKLEVSADAPQAKEESKEEPAIQVDVAPPEPKKAPPTEPPPPPKRSPVAPPKVSSDRKIVHASPAIRRFARELGVDITGVRGTGRKGRITKADVQAFVKDAINEPKGGALPPMPEVDFSRWGEVELQPLSKINKLTAKNLHRSWLHVPLVTQYDDADITDLEAFRKASKPEAERRGFKLTFVTFILKACGAALKEYPRFNSSLDVHHENLVLKKYVNIGVAVDTPKGLVVPVLRDVDKKGLFQLAEELGELSAKARAGKLMPGDMQGGTFTISSLGGIGGTKFTPLVSAPEVAILGVSRAKKQPVWDGERFAPRLMLPLSLSYDHRVIDGADGARFVTHLSHLLSDFRRVLL